MNQPNNDHNMGAADQNMLFEAMETNNMMNNMPPVTHVPFVLSAPGQSNLIVDSRSSFGGGVITPFLYDHGNMMNTFNQPLENSSHHSYNRLNEPDNSMTAQKKKAKKKKVGLACIYCRRSHMTCDRERPCLRCVKRGIGHMCHDEPTTDKVVPVKTEHRSMENETIDSNDSVTSTHMYNSPKHTAEDSATAESNTNVNTNFETANLASANRDHNHDNDLDYGQGPLFHSEYIGSEFSSLNEFLSLMDETSPYGLPGIQTDLIELVSTTTNDSYTADSLNNPAISYLGLNKSGRDLETTVSSSTSGPEKSATNDDARDKFFLTAADPPVTHSPEDRLTQVINAKLDAGLLKPFNHASGYARLQKYMDNYMNQSSRQRILKPISTFRPAFRAVASSLKDVNLVLVEEAFERMLLEYDRVFTSMAIPACLWRRTGEIYRGNKEFAGLVNVSVEDLRNGKLAIYELMSEESAVNYWEKYGQIAFDIDQKGVLTSCNLRTKDGRRRNACCFSFTIQRDRYNIPSCIVGHFIPVSR
ncbi:hypothetical protein NADFUDRAFT_81425 [Nadsonia fulvescens var. elongata DSM 6958]|uniref:Zn(2)-C6 fungal-type domain-containing protein n=1 Tax=Nadsonia fulvescens var. elongata DSM 6958 TaxID=857566 RepID=A0A1E3PSR5_9ASCO|nr:hypothetical protein NADFUDRAFT_81425 [Nadsonia fulvescens var. elongata DSM 6958]